MSLIDEDREISTFEAWLWLALSALALIAAFILGQINQDTACAKPDSGCAVEAAA